MEHQPADYDVVILIRHKRVVQVFKVVLCEASSVITVLDQMNKTFSDVAHIFKLEQPSGSFIQWLKGNNFDCLPFIYSGKRLTYTGSSRTPEGISKALIRFIHLSNVELPRVKLHSCFAKPVTSNLRKASPSPSVKHSSTETSAESSSGDY